MTQGKWVIVQEHPSNHFFSAFKNCLTYNTPEQFSAHLKTALETDPHPVRASTKAQKEWNTAYLKHS